MSSLDLEDALKDDSEKTRLIKKQFHKDICGKLSDIIEFHKDIIESLENEEERKET